MRLEHVNIGTAVVVISENGSVEVKQARYTGRLGIVDLPVRGAIEAGGGRNAGIERHARPPFHSREWDCSSPSLDLDSSLAYLEKMAGVILLTCCGKTYWVPAAEAEKTYTSS